MPAVTTPAARALAAAALALVIALALAFASSARAAGTRDFSYAGVNQPTAPSGEKPQSKLWFNDGSWWGALWSTTAKALRHPALRAAPSGWTDTRSVIDSRDKSLADMLWDGTHLYALSAIRQGGVGDDPSGPALPLLLRHAQHELRARLGLPGRAVHAGELGRSRDDGARQGLDRRALGDLHLRERRRATARRPRPARRGAACSTPIAFPATRLDACGRPAGRHASDVRATTSRPSCTSGRRSACSSRSERRRQRRHRRLLRRPHRRRAPGNRGREETPLRGVLMADDHLNVKAAPDGRVYRRGEDLAQRPRSAEPGRPDDPAAGAATDGVWSQTTFDTVASQDTRSQVVLDPRDRRPLPVRHLPAERRPTRAAARSTSRPRAWTRRFHAGARHAVHRVGRRRPINNFSSTKQTVSAATGLLGIAADDPANVYLHGWLVPPAPRPGAGPGVVARPTAAGSRPPRKVSLRALTHRLRRSAVRSA